MHTTNFIVLLCVVLDRNVLPKAYAAVFSQTDGGKHTEEMISRDSTNEKINTCGYESCPVGEDGMLNVHLVAHTHDDVGWLKTVDQYYYGADNQIEQAGVQYILDTVIRALDKNPDRKFIYVEMAFFSRWWRNQNNSTQELVRKFVNEGRLQFILGGWCMNDEAATHYTAIIDQHTTGFKFLQENFGECGRPKIGWQIDPFGHSREQASLFAQFGMDGLFFGRLDYQDKIARLFRKEMEMVWSGSDSLGDQAALMTGVAFNHYAAPTFFCFDAKCDDPPIMDDPSLHGYNVDQRVDRFLKEVDRQSKVFATNNIMLTMGGDFQYANADKNFKNLDKLIKYVNARKENGSKVNVFYSTPACYTYALYKSGVEHTVKTDDFFPYADRPHGFWTGYFTSRPALKRLVRTSNNFFQACKQIHTLSQLRNINSSMEKIQTLREALGIAQHHDAISGTEKQAVAFDYAERVALGISQCENVIADVYVSIFLSNSTNTASVPEQMFCPLLNASVCRPSESLSMFSVVVYNSLAQPRTSWIRIPVVNNNNRFVVKDANGGSVASEVIPLSKESMNLPEHNGSLSNSELVFAASNIPPLGYTTYLISKTAGSEETRLFTETNKEEDIQIIRNEFLQIGFSSSGLVSSLTNVERGKTIPLSQQPMFYESKNFTSGAYLFTPRHNTPSPISTSARVSVIKNDLMEEARQVFSDWYSQVVRLYKGEKYVEFEWTVGPIPIEDKLGKEVINLFSTSLATKSTFYTDANGRQILQRIRDYRPTWRFVNTEPVSGNYYPVTSSIFIRDEVSKDMQFTVLNDRAQGGSSIRDGEIELMVHRRLLHDDHKGVGEALNETGITGKGLVVRGTHYVMYDTISDSVRMMKEMSHKIFAQPVLAFAKVNNENNFVKLTKTQSGLTSSLPANVKLLSLEQWDNSSVLLRLEHVYEVHDDPVYGKPVSVSLKNFFPDYEVTSATELTLGANQKLSEAQRLEWIVDNSRKTHGKISDFVVPVFPENLTVTLKPMQIRTFQVTLINLTTVH